MIKYPARTDFCIKAETSPRFFVLIIELFFKRLYGIEGFYLAFFSLQENHFSNSHRAVMESPLSCIEFLWK